MEKRWNVSIVSIDNYLGAVMATEHLLGLGKKHIGHIAGPLDWWEARQRKAGWETTLTAAGLNVTDNMWASGNWSSKSGKLAFAELVNNYPEMDAVFVGNDQMALSVLQSALELHKKIPDNLSVVGFDGIPESEFYCPPLTTICQNQNDLGRIAVEELVGLVENSYLTKELPEPKYITIQPELVIRQSS